MEIPMPKQVQQIMERLNGGGHEAYAVGGCIRDSLLGRKPEDWDITTSATPEQVKAVFRRTVDTGLEHGTVTVLLDGGTYEVTTYRLDGEYEDGRHPKSVEFTTDLLEDLKRRDFTINAMAYSQNTGVVDTFGGRKDLAEGMIRCVGDPLQRFTEDALRILRAIRFSAQLDFQIEEKTLKAISQIAPNMVQVSKERIQVELGKLLLSHHPEKIRLVYDTGISQYISEKFHSIPWKKTYVVPSMPAVRHMRWASFLCNVSPEDAVQVLKDLKLDNDTTDKVRMLVSRYGEQIVPDQQTIRILMSQMPPDWYDDLLVFKRNVIPSVQTQSELDAVKRLSEEIRTAGDCISLKELAVNGSDLIQAGVKPGKELGRILQKLLEMVLKDPGMNEREVLLGWIWNV